MGGSLPPSITDGCAISVPWTETQDKISEAIETLTVTDEINTDLNKLFKYKSDGTLKTNPEGKPYRPGGTQEGTAILAVEASINAFKQKIDHLLLDLDNYLNNIELMMNGNVPGSFLVAFEQGTTCVKKATVDFTSVVGCESGCRQMHCKVRVLQKGSGEQTHKLVPIPYHSDNRTLQVKFSDDLVFKKGSGLILDISQCETIQDAFRCDNPDFEANSGLEDLEVGTSLDEIPESCKVVEIPVDRPLLVPVEKGHLIAQRSDVPLAIKYRENPFLTTRSLFQIRRKLL